MGNRDKLVLEKVLKEIDVLNDLVAKTTSCEDFIASETVKRAAAMTLINIGELARGLSDEFKRNNQNIPLNEIIGLRNVTAHGYQTLRFDDVWKTIKTDIPKLEKSILDLLA